MIYSILFNIHWRLLGNASKTVLNSSICFFWFWFVYKQSLFTRAYTLVNCAQRCSEHLVCYWCSRGGCTEELSWLMLSLRKKKIIKKSTLPFFLIKIFASGLTENSVLLRKHAVLPLSWPCVMSLRAPIPFTGWWQRPRAESELGNVFPHTTRMQGVKTEC